VTISPDNCLDTILAYHAKVREQLLQLRQIEADLGKRDGDSLYEAAQLSGDVLQTLGAEMKLHERDEGASLFPRLEAALEASGESEPELEEELSHAVEEHEDAAKMWRFLREWLWRIQTPDAIISLDLLHEAIDTVEAHLLDHLEQEERLIFPAAKRLLSLDQLDEIAEEMRERRARRSRRQKKSH